MLEIAMGQSGLLGLGLHAYRPVLGQIVNVGFGPAGILGLCIAGAGAGLYLLRSMRPELARDYDIFFSAIGLLCGGILFFNGWRLDPILMFGQVLMAGSAVFFAFESIRLRSIATGQARRSAPPRDDDDRSYSVDRVYRAELDELEPYMEDRPPLRRIRGSRDSASSNRNAYSDRSAYDGSYDGDNPYGNMNLEDERATRRSSSRRSSRSSRSEGGSDYGTDSESRNSSYSDSTPDYSSRRRSSRRRGSETSRSDAAYPPRRRPTASRDRYYDDEPPAPRRRSRSGSSSRTEESGDDYVDYKPISRYSDDYSSGGSPSSRYDDEWGAS